MVLKFDRVLRDLFFCCVLNALLSINARTHDHVIKPNQRIENAAKVIHQQSNLVQKTTYQNIQTHSATPRKQNLFLQKQENFCFTIGTAQLLVVISFKYCDIDVEQSKRDFSLIASEILECGDDKHTFSHHHNNRRIAS